MKKEKYLDYKMRGICKTCASEYEANRLQIKKAELVPTMFMQCDNCDKTFSKRSRGNFRMGSFKTKVKCPYCDSNNIVSF